MSEASPYPPVPTLSTALAARCPRCGKGRLFAGYLRTATRCEICGLDYGFVDSADGPAVFAMLFVGAAVVIAAFIVEIVYQPPYWVHAVLWVPAILILSLGLLRPLKALLIVIQYRHKAAEGRLEEPEH